VHIDCSRGFCLGISQMYISYFNQIKPLLLNLSLLSGFPITQQLSVHFVILSSHTDAVWFNIIYFLSFSFPLLPYQSPLRQTHYYSHVLSLIFIYIYTHICI
jgi:hypothetical protein